MTPILAQGHRFAHPQHNKRVDVNGLIYSFVVGPTLVEDYLRRPNR